MVKLNRSFVTTILVLMIIFIQLFGATQIIFAKDSDTQRVYDDANLLTKSEIQLLEKKAAEYSEERKTDFMIITTEDANVKNAESYVADFYDKGKPGDAAILSVDMSIPDVYIASFKKTEKLLGYKRTDLILDRIVPHLQNEDYYKSFDLYLDKAYEYTGVKFGLNPEGVLFKTWFQLLIGLIIAGIVLFSMLKNIGGKITVSGRTYNDGEHTKVIGQTDRYIRTSVTRIKKPSNNSNGGRGGGMTGGGSSYGGSGRRF